MGIAGLGWMAMPVYQAPRRRPAQKCPPPLLFFPQKAIPITQLGRKTNQAENPAEFKPIPLSWL